MSNEINVPHTFSQLEGKFKRMETEVILDDGSKFSLTTYQKTSGDKCLLTYASVSKQLPCRGAGDAFLYGHRMGHDYHRVLEAAKLKRVTANAVTEQHGRYLSQLQMIVEAAKKYYGWTAITLEASK